MTENIEVKPEVLLVLEAKRLMTEYTFVLPRFNVSEFREAQRRLLGFDPESPACMACVLEILRDAYEEFGRVEIKDKDFPVFAEWGRKAWEFMPAPDIGGAQGHPLSKCEQAEYEWFSRGKKGWRPNNPVAAASHDYETLLKEMRKTYEDRLQEERIARSRFADQLDIANASLSDVRAARWTDLKNIQRLQRLVDELTAENAALKLRLKERGNK